MKTVDTRSVVIADMMSQRFGPDALPMLLALKRAMKGHIPRVEFVTLNQTARLLRGNSDALLDHSGPGALSSQLHG